MSSAMKLITCLLHNFSRVHGRVNKLLSTALTIKVYVKKKNKKKNTSENTKHTREDAATMYIRYFY